MSVGESEPEFVARLIREVGVPALAGFDGCICGSFCVRGVHVDISCGKGGPRGISVWSRHARYSDSILGEGETLDCIADEVRAQMNRTPESFDFRGPIEVRVEKEKTERAA